MSGRFRQLLMPNALSTFSKFYVFCGYQHSKCSTFSPPTLLSAPSTLKSADNFLTRIRFIWASCIKGWNVIKDHSKRTGQGDPNHTVYFERPNCHEILWIRPGFARFSDEAVLSWGKTDQKKGKFSVIFCHRVTSWVTWWVVMSHLLESQSGSRDELPWFRAHVCKWMRSLQVTIDMLCEEAAAGLKMFRHEKRKKKRRKENVQLRGSLSKLIIMK